MHRGSGSGKELGTLQRHPQGCVERSRGLEDPNLPLSAPTVVPLAPRSPNLMVGDFCELLRPDVLGSNSLLSSCLQLMVFGKVGVDLSRLPADRCRSLVW